MIGLLLTSFRFVSIALDNYYNCDPEMQSDMHTVRLITVSALQICGVRDSGGINYANPYLANVLILLLLYDYCLLTELQWNVPILVYYKHKHRIIARHVFSMFLHITNATLTMS